MLSRPLETNPWQTGLLTKLQYSPRPIPPSHFPIQPVHQTRTTFRPSSLQLSDTTSQDEFKPFIPLDYKNYPTHTVAHTNSFPSKPNKQILIKNQDQENYSYFKIGGPSSKPVIFTSVPQTKYPQGPYRIQEKHPFNHRSPVTFPPLSQGVYKTGEGIYIRPQEVREHTIPNKTVVSISLVHSNSKPLRTTPVHSYQDGVFGGSEYPENHKPETTTAGQTKSEETSYEIPDFFNKPFPNKYENYENPFANPNFNFDKFIENLRESHNKLVDEPKTTTEKPLHKNHKPEHSGISFDSSQIVLKTPVPSVVTTIKPKLVKTTPSDYYYYDDESSEKPKIYSSQIKVANSSASRVTTPKPSLDDEYYYEEYEYEEIPEEESEKTLNKTDDVKYSSKYLEKTVNTTLKPKQGSKTAQSAYYEYDSNPVHNHKLTTSTTTPKTLYTIRQRPKQKTTTTMTKPTTRPKVVNVNRHRPSNTKTDHDIKDQLNLAAR